MLVSLCIYALTIGHLGRSQFFTIKNNVSVNDPNLPPCEMVASLERQEEQRGGSPVSFGEGKLIEYPLDAGRYARSLQCMISGWTWVVPEGLVLGSLKSS